MTNGSGTAGGTGPSTLLPSGSQVVLVVSKGPGDTPPSAYVETPNIVGQQQGEALSALQAAELNARTFTDPNVAWAQGTVMGQLPPAGESAAVGSSAVVLVSSGPPDEQAVMTRLPEVVGMKQEDAVAELQRSGLTPQVIHDNNRTYPEGVVASQLPNRASLAAQPATKSSLVWLWVLLAILAVVAIGVGIWWAMGQTATVPDVVGMDQAQAEAALTDAGFKLGSVTTTPSDDAEGKVVEQDPAAGSEARKGSAVDLVIAGGPELVEVPDVLRMKADDAQKALEGAGFETAVTEAFDDTVAEGDVISQSPSAGQKVPKGTTVGITVSKGPEPELVTVPNVVGLTQTAAQDALKGAGLAYQVAENYDDEVAAGNVITQLPDGGAKVAPGTTVGLLVSKGPQPSGGEQVQVPNVVGQQQAQAQDAIKAVGLVPLRIQWGGSGKPSGEVVDQTPEKGQMVPKGSTVVIYVSDGT